MPSKRAETCIVLTAAVLSCARQLHPKGPSTTPSVASSTIPPSPPDESALDCRVEPCQDFYRFACGGWLTRTPIPPDRPAWSRSFSEIAERNLGLERRLLES